MTVECVTSYKQVPSYEKQHSIYFCSFDKSNKKTKARNIMKANTHEKKKVRKLHLLHYSLHRFEETCGAFWEAVNKC